MSDDVTRDGLVLERVGDRERPPAAWEALFAGGWPAFIDADPLAAAHLPRVREVFADLQVVLVDEHAASEEEQLLAAAWGVPIAWDGDAEHLPGGYGDALGAALAGHDGRAAADTLVLCAAQVHPRAGRRGLAATVLTGLSDLAAASGLHRVVAPLRPTLKHRYPLTSIEDYVRFRRPDGEPLDPWLRTHARMGARVIATSPASQTFVGTVTDWERWSGLALPASGDYVVDRALAPLHLDHPADRGTLVEPGIWVRHG